MVRVSEQGLEEEEAQRAAAATAAEQDRQREWEEAELQRETLRNNQQKRKLLQGYVAGELRAVAERAQVVRLRELLWAGVEPDDAAEQDEGGRGPLWLAADHGHTSCVVELLAAGAEPDAAADAGSTPLMQASASGHVAVIEKLLQAGADPLLEDGLGSNARQRAGFRGDKTAVNAAFDRHRVLHSARSKIGAVSAFKSAADGGLYARLKTAASSPPRGPVHTDDDPSQYQLGPGVCFPGENYAQMKKRTGRDDRRDEHLDDAHHILSSESSGEESEDEARSTTRTERMAQAAASGRPAATGHKSGSGSESSPLRASGFGRRGNRFGGAGEQVAEAEQRRSRNKVTFKSGALTANAVAKAVDGCGNE